MIIGRRLRLSRTCTKCAKERCPGGCRFRIFGKVYAGNELLFWMMALQTKRSGFVDHDKLKSEAVTKEVLTKHCHPWYVKS